MKKIFSFVIVLAAVAMVSCGGNAQPAAEATEVEATVVEVAPVADTTAAVVADTTACQAACPSK